jgi:hypothetical protein
MLSCWSIPTLIIVAWRIILSAFSKVIQTTQQRLEVPRQSAKWLAISLVQLMAIIILTVSTELMGTGKWRAATMLRSKVLTKARSKGWQAIERVDSREVRKLDIGQHANGTHENHKISMLPNHHTWRQRGTALALSVLAMQAHATVSTERRTTFDTDSETVGIDNRCSGCISHIETIMLGTSGHPIGW